MSSSLESEHRSFVIVAVTALLAGLGALASCHAHTADAIKACREACGGHVAAADMANCRCRWGEP